MKLMKGELIASGDTTSIDGIKGHGCGNIEEDNLIRSSYGYYTFGL